LVLMVVLEMVHVLVRVVMVVGVVLLLLCKIRVTIKRSILMTDIVVVKTVSLLNRRLFKSKQIDFIFVGICFFQIISICV
jgi:hypothetical protein